MMIDEAIAYEKARAEELRSHIGTWDEEYSHKCERYAEKHERYAEWLEELKDYRDKNKMVVKIDCVNSEEFKDMAVKFAKEQYNKAIDDLAEKIVINSNRLNIDTDDFEEFGDNVANVVYGLAEQLKATVKVVAEH